MDVCKSEKQVSVNTSRLPLGPAVRNYDAADTSIKTHRIRAKEVSSRYRTPTPSSTSRRSASPNTSGTPLGGSQLVPRRAQSTERKRTSTSSCSSPTSVAARDSSIDTQLTRRLSTGSRFPDGLWPSTMRSLNVSFQSDSISIPISKKEKSPSTGSIFSSDCTSRTSSSFTRKKAESPSSSRKSTPERKRSPQSGKSVQDQSENAKSVDNPHSRLIDQHRWPSRIGGKLSNSLVRSLDLSERTRNGALTSSTDSMYSFLDRRTPALESMGAQGQKFGGSSKLLLEQYGRLGFMSSLGDDNLPHDVQRPLSTSLSARTSVSMSASRILPVPSAGSRSASPTNSSASRGTSPVRTRSSTPPSRGVSPSRARVSSIPSQANCSSVLNFIVDIRKSKKGVNFIEEAHQLRLMYNRYLQWRFVNARTEMVLHSRRLVAEKTLFYVWKSTTDLQDLVIKKRITLQQLHLEIKLNAILKNQIVLLDSWATLEGDHVNSISRAADDLQASIVRLPVTGGAKVDVETLRDAICSAVDIMQSMASSMRFLLSRVENINVLASDLAALAALEGSMLQEFDALLSSVTRMLVKEYSIRTHLIQLKTKSVINN